MAPLLQENDIVISEEEKKEALQELYKELEKGIWSLKNERIYLFHPFFFVYSQKKGATL